VLYLLVAGVLGLLIGAAIAVLRDLLDVTVKVPDDIQKTIDKPVMAHVAYDPGMAKHPLLTDTPGNNARSEALRVLRTNLQFLDLDQEAKSFVVTSAVPGEGKTSTSTNLAIALAQAGKKVLLVDGDLRRPRLASLLNLESAVGLTTVLVGRSDLRSTIQVHAASGVNVLTSGPIPPNPSEVLQSRATKDLMKLLRESFDTVIIDAPPLLPVADAAIMATQVDGAILVVRHGKTTKDQVKLAANRVGQVGARLFGVVVNMTPRRGGSEFGYDYGYGYGYYESASAAGSHRYAGADR
jgi:receptor protein-tyrosine kinase